MFDISFTELLLVVVLATIFIGPKEFPTVVRAVAKVFFQIKKFWNEMKEAMGDLARESGVDDIKRELEDEYLRDMKMIEGDDGEMYEAFDMGELESEELMTPLANSKDSSSQRRLGSSDDSAIHSEDPGLRRDDSHQSQTNESPYKFPTKGAGDE